MASTETEQEMDRTEAAPLTSERRYGIYRTGLAAASVLIVVLAGAGIALLLGVRDATVMLCVLLPLMLLSALLAHLFLWWQHKRAIRRREIAATEWVSATYARQQAQSIAPPESPSASNSWFRRFSQRNSTRSTPPPGYHAVTT